MSIEELNKCLSKFYVSARKKDGSYYKKSSLLSIRAAIDRYLKSPPHNKNFSICDQRLFNEANSTLNAYLKHLTNTGSIAATVHKNPLTSEVVKKLFDEGELGPADTEDPRVLLQTAWFYVTLYLGKRGRENQSSLNASMLRLVQSGDNEFFELDKAQPGTVLPSKNHTGGLQGTEDHSDGKIFPKPNSDKCPVKTLKAYLSHLNPSNPALFQRPKDISVRFNPKEEMVWYEMRKLGHNTLENMLRKMTERAGITPYLTNHSMRATTVTVLSTNNVETRNIKAVTGHKSDCSIESYCEKPSLRQFQHMSTAITNFIHGGDCDDASSSLALEVPEDIHLPEKQQLSESRPLPLGRNEENFLVSNGVNPGAILPSGSFLGCSFTFNINIINSK